MREVRRRFTVGGKLFETNGLVVRPARGMNAMERDRLPPWLRGCNHCTFSGLANIPQQHEGHLADRFGNLAVGIRVYVGDFILGVEKLPLPPGFHIEVLAGKHGYCLYPYTRDKDYEQCPCGSGDVVLFLVCGEVRVELMG